MSDSEYEDNYLDPGHIRDRTSAVYRRRPQYVGFPPRALASVRVATDPDDRMFTPSRVMNTPRYTPPRYQNPTEGINDLFRQVDGHDYDSGGALSMLADVASQPSLAMLADQSYGFID